mmetsp:Transcript_103225/g.205174  ORF Transcript_103225/g.205174 Transcript_103225/m.205174 type:complete len:213 (-) Transcript_103225:62-700(-)
MKSLCVAILCSQLGWVEAARRKSPIHADSEAGCHSQAECAANIARAIIANSRECFNRVGQNRMAFETCTHSYCSKQCGSKSSSCQKVCNDHADPLFLKFTKDRAAETKHLVASLDDAEGEQAAAMDELVNLHSRMRNLNQKFSARAREAMKSGNDTGRARADLAKMEKLTKLQDQIDQHLETVHEFRGIARHAMHAVNHSQKPVKPAFLQKA